MTDRERLIQEVESGEKSAREVIRAFLKVSIDLYMDIAAMSDEDLKESFLNVMKNSRDLLTCANMTSKELFEGLMIFCANCNQYYFVRDCRLEDEKLKCPEGDIILDGGEES